MSLTDYLFLAALAGVVVLVLNDAINGATAAIRELLQVMRKDKP